MTYLESLSELISLLLLPMKYLVMFESLIATKFIKPKFDDY